VSPAVATQQTLGIVIIGAGSFTKCSQPIDAIERYFVQFYSYVADDIDKALASQAAYEGSIPFARSNTSPI
jgi:hypothetical protein